MALYELRTYALHVGKMAEAVKLYQEIGFPVFQKAGQDKSGLSSRDVRREPLDRSRDIT